MEIINTIVGTPLGAIFRACLSVIGSYGIAVFVFTLITKIILMPLSIWVQKNSIKMVRLHPKLNEIRAEFIADKNRQADLELELYKQEKYRPMAGVIPMLIQVPVILGLINVVYNPLQHLLQLDSGLITSFLETAKAALGIEELGSGAQITVMKMVQDPQYAQMFASAMGSGTAVSEAIAAIQDFSFEFIGLDLSTTPKLFAMEALSCIPWLSGASAFLLAWCQNRVNVLQKEASFFGRWGMAAFLSAFSLYFATLVPAAVGIYWVFSNLLAIVVLFVVNAIYPPKRYVDYEALEKSKQLLANAKQANSQNKLSKEDRARSKADYKRFLDAENKKQLVFYSEKSGYYKYFHRLIEALLERSNVVIHYISSDPNDAIFNVRNERIQTYFIDANRLIMLFMLIDADVMVMSLPDLQTFHLKRSYMRPDMEYVYVHHGIIAGLSALRDHALDAYDTVFCGERNQKKEMEAYIEANNLPQKHIIECGYGVIEDMHEQYLRMQADNAVDENKKTNILIAPSWQEDNILESCLPQILACLCNGKNRVIIRPHPQYIRRFSGKLEEIRRSVAEYLGEDCMFEMDFSSNKTVYTADIMMTDWSTIAFEYAFSTENPVLFIHTKQKIVNERSDELFDQKEQLDIKLRTVIGYDLMPETLSETLPKAVEDLKTQRERYKEKIRSVRDSYVYNFGRSGEVGANYIIGRLFEFEQKRQEEERELEA